jgi:hypothetical protein
MLGVIVIMIDGETTWRPTPAARRISAVTDLCHADTVGWPMLILDAG